MRYINQTKKLWVVNSLEINLNNKQVVKGSERREKAIEMLKDPQALKRVGEADKTLMLYKNLILF